MKLRVLLPSRVLVDDDGVDAVRAEADDGVFALERRHVDVVSEIAAGILSWSVGSAERLAAVDRGTLVKHGETIEVAVRDGVLGESLERLRETVRKKLLRRQESERRALAAVARLESNLVRRFLEVGGSDGT